MIDWKLQKADGRTSLSFKWNAFPSIIYIRLPSFRIAVHHNGKCDPSRIRSEHVPALDLGWRRKKYRMVAGQNKRNIIATT